MKKQINFNAVTEAIHNQFKENNVDAFDYLLDTIHGLTNNENLFEIVKKQKFDEYKLMVLVKAIFAQCDNQKIDLNKYFPLFVET